MYLIRSDEASVGRSILRWPFEKKAKCCYGAGAIIRLHVLCTADAEGGGKCLMSQLLLGEQFNNITWEKWGIIIWGF